MIHDPALGLESSLSGGRGDDEPRAERDTHGVEHRALGQHGPPDTARLRAHPDAAVSASDAAGDNVLALR